ncbi:MAG TPA: Clp protease N-terminal domain-containing protein [Acidimicrobiales bacterium]|nr:Clp protease N-terminal domain-containing protein [Acidimicrobiales bacterium]
MFERFTDRARRVLVLAQDEARDLEHNFLGTEHVLLGLVREGEGVGAKALIEMGVDLAAVRRRVTDVVKPGAPGTASGAPPFTPRAKKVLELSLREALDLGHNYIGTEHLLLALIREGEGVASQVLTAAGLTPGQVRRKVIDLLRGYGSAPTAPRPQADRDTSTSPAVEQLGTRARAVAGADVVGSHHYLLGLLEDADCLAARVLASFGVTAEAVASRAAEIGVAGTTDEPSRPDVVPSLPLGEGIILTIDDASLRRDAQRWLEGELPPEELLAKLRERMKRPGDEGGHAADA